MSNTSNRDENKGALLGLCAALIVVGFIQLLGLMEGDSDDIHLRQIEQALEVCENNGGLHMIDGEMFNTHKFRCRNGAVFTYDPKRELKREVFEPSAATSCIDNPELCESPEGLEREDHDND